MAREIKLLPQGRVTIPKKLRDRCGWSGGTILELIVDGDQLLIKEVKSSNRVQTRGLTG